MIRTFKDKELEKLLEGNRVKSIPPEILKRAFTKLLMLNAAVSISDLKIPPSNHLEALSGDRMGQYSIRVNDKYRVCFKWENGDAFDVEIVDYH